MTQPKDQIRKNSIWVVMGKFADQGAQFIFGIILARLLVPGDFGLMVAIQIFTGLAGFVSGAGMGSALIQAKQVDNRHFQVVFTIQLLICSLIYMTFYHGAPYIAEYMHNSAYIDLIRVSAMSFLTRPFINIPRAKLVRDMRFNTITIYATISGLVTGVTSISFAHFHNGVWSMIWGGLIGALALIPLMLNAARVPLSIRYDSRIAKELGSMGVKFTANDLLVYLRGQAPNFIIGKFLGPHTVGLFNKGDSLSAYPFNFIATSAYDTVFRALSTYQDNLDKSKYIFLRTITLSTVYTFPFYTGLFWTSEELVVLVFGEKWLLAAIPLKIISFSRMTDCIGNPAGAVLAAQNLLTLEMILQFISLVLISVGCWYGVTVGDLDTISMELLPGIFFVNITATCLAMWKIRVSSAELISALTPAVILNGLLFILLAALDWALNHYFPDASQIHRLSYLVSIGGTFYAILFLFLPINQLKSESDKWKALLLPKRNRAI